MTVIGKEFCHCIKLEKGDCRNYSGIKCLAVSSMLKYMLIDCKRYVIRIPTLIKSKVVLES